MNDVAAALAKLAGTRKAVANALENEVTGRGERIRQNYPSDEVGHYFDGTAAQMEILCEHLPELFADFQSIDTQPRVEMARGSDGIKPANRYSRRQLEILLRNIDQIFEIRANSELRSPSPMPAPVRRVFISHGRSPDWREVQAYIEKDIGLPTLELAQEVNQGRTILAKLWEESGRCDSAVIVMTGEDLDDEGQARARENVIHEIGFFQGKYGLDRICLLHEEGVSTPSNIAGLVYAPFPKGRVSASFGLLIRELKAMYG